MESISSYLFTLFLRQRAPQTWYNTVFCDTKSCGLAEIISCRRFGETCCQTIRHRVPEDSRLHGHRSEKRTNTCAVDLELVANGLNSAVLLLLFMMSKVQASHQKLAPPQ
jgi:hypothetical protein